jgi:hypothetical protein
MTRAILLAVVLLLGDAPVPAAMYRVVLAFPDGSVEICNASGFTIDYLTINVAVDTCIPDEIFRNGFEP